MSESKEKITVEQITAFQRLWLECTDALSDYLNGTEYGDDSPDYHGVLHTLKARKVLRYLDESGKIINSQQALLFEREVTIRKLEAELVELKEIQSNMSRDNIEMGNELIELKANGIFPTHKIGTVLWAKLSGGSDKRTKTYVHAVQHDGQRWKYICPVDHSGFLGYFYENEVFTSDLEQQALASLSKDREPINGGKV